jgi:amino acid transporter
MFYRFTEFLQTPQMVCSYYALTGTIVMTLLGGYEVFLNGNWDVPNFLFSYLMVGVVPVLFVSWKIIKKTKVSIQFLHIVQSLTELRL